MGMAIGAPRYPRFPHEPIVHAREIPVSLAEFPTQQRHSFDDARVGQTARIDEAKGHRLGDVDEGLLGSLIVTDDKDVAYGPVERRRIEYFPPHVLKRPYDSALRKVPLEFFRPAGVAGQHKIQMSVVQ